MCIYCLCFYSHNLPFFLLSEEGNAKHRAIQWQIFFQVAWRIVRRSSQCRNKEIQNLLELNQLVTPGLYTLLWDFYCCKRVWNKMVYYEERKGRGKSWGRGGRRADSVETRGVGNKVTFSFGSMTFSLVNADGLWPHLLANRAAICFLLTQLLLL